jgi:hypothetical protein
VTVRIVLFLVMGGLALKAVQGAQPGRSLFAGSYKEGERMTYLMKGVNENWRYEIQAAGVVKKDSVGKYVEEYSWSHLVSNGVAVTLPPSGLRFREVLSLDPEKPISIPNLSAAPPVLIGPITDLATFYVDLWLATRLGDKLSHVGDHAFLKVGIPASWADGRRVVLGESAVDFDVSLLKVDRARQIAVLIVRHVPPAQPRVRLPAPWMHKPVAGTPNNWVQVTRKDDKFVAGVGKETFDVRMKVSLEDGRILSASIENLVKGQERDCRDPELTHCGDSRLLRNTRHVEISLER